MAYNKYDKNKAAQRVSTKAYSFDELNDIRILIANYYKNEIGDVALNTYRARFDSLASAINNAKFEGKEIIKAKYLSEIYNGIDTSKNKSIMKITAIKDFLSTWFTSYTKNKEEELGKEDSGVIKDWDATTNTSTPQWTAYVALPIKDRMVKRFSCDVVTKSKYYRFGFKFLQASGKLFGDGSIQAQDKNFIIHIGKNFLIKDLFITVYRNGIREATDKFTDIIPKSNRYNCELYVDQENLLHFFINRIEVYKGIVDNEIKSRVYMLMWGDGNNYDAKIKDIKIETERA
jgi:hypothetical protein